MVALFRTFAEYGLGCIFPQRAGATVDGFLPAAFEIISRCGLSHQNSLEPLLGLVWISCGVSNHSAGHAFCSLDQGLNQQGLR